MSQGSNNWKIRLIINNRLIKNWVHPKIFCFKFASMLVRWFWDKIHVYKQLENCYKNPNYWVNSNKLNVKKCYLNKRFWLTNNCVNQYSNAASCSADIQCYANGGLSCQSGKCQCIDSSNKWVSNWKLFKKLSSHLYKTIINSIWYFKATGPHRPKHVFLKSQLTSHAPPTMSVRCFIIAIVNACLRNLMPLHV